MVIGTVTAAAAGAAGAAGRRIVQHTERRRERDQSRDGGHGFPSNDAIPGRPAARYVALDSSSPRQRGARLRIECCSAEHLASTRHAVVDYETGVRAAQEFVDLVGKLPFDATPAQAALAWVVQQEGVTTVAPAAISEDVSASCCTMSPPATLTRAARLSDLDASRSLLRDDVEYRPRSRTDGNDLLVVHCC